MMDVFHRLTDKDGADGDGENLWLVDAVDENAVILMNFSSLTADCSESCQNNNF